MKVATISPTPQSLRRKLWILQLVLSKVTTLPLDAAALTENKKIITLTSSCSAGYREKQSRDCMINLHLTEKHITLKHIKL